MIASNLKPEAEQALLDLLLHGGARSAVIAQRAISNFRAEAAAAKDAEIADLREQLADQRRTTKYYADQSARRGEQLKGKGGQR